MGGDKRGEGKGGRILSLLETYCKGINSLGLFCMDQGC